MATNHVHTGLAVQKSEATAARKMLIFNGVTGKTYVVTVSKAGGAFGATAGSVATEIGATAIYKLAIHATDIDTEGMVVFCCTDTDITYVVARVVNNDPYVHYDADDPVANAAVGKAVADDGAGTLKVYDDAGTGVLKTLTHVTVGDVTTRTPS